MRSRSYWIIGLFFVTAPLMTYLLLFLKGLPAFASPHLPDVAAWVFHVTWVPALLSGCLLGVIVSTATARTRIFTEPYDFGRCFSLGAISGALSEASSTWLYRHFSHRPFSGFWLAGATISGCVAGAAVTALVLGLCEANRRAAGL